MSCKNMPVEKWTPDQLESGIIQLHIQRLAVKGGKVHHGPSVTIHTTDRAGLFDAALKAVVKLGVVPAYDTKTVQDDTND